MSVLSDLSVEKDPRTSFKACWNFVCEDSKAMERNLMWFLQQVASTQEMFAKEKSSETVLQATFLNIRDSLVKQS